MDEDIPTGNLCAYVLLTDIGERCLVLKRDLEHLLNVSKFVRDYFYTDKRGGTVFLNYRRVLRLMYKDVCRILDIINELRKKLSDPFIDQSVIQESLELFCTEDVVGTPVYGVDKLIGEAIDVLKKGNKSYIIIKKRTEENKKTKEKTFGIPSEKLGIKDDRIVIQAKEFNEDEAEKIGKEYEEMDTLFKEFKRIRLYKKMKNFKIDDYLTLALVIRDELERRQTRPFEISLNVLNLALRGLRYSLDQAMRGIFAGHIIEQEPTAYTHRDLYHVIRYLTMYCDWYYRSMINFVQNLFTSENLKTFFYKLTGVYVKKESMSDMSMPYLIVLGDRTSPTLIERYNLISLPIVCAYRPRYWSTVSHEVAHTFVNGLLYVKWAFEDFEEFYRKEKLLREIDLKKFENFMDVLKVINLASRKLEGWGLFEPKRDRERWFEQFLATEILADIFAFLLSGYAYIQTASDLFAVGKPFPPIKNRIPFLVRLHAIYEFACSMLKDRESSLKTAIECIKNYVKDDKCNNPLKDALRDSILKEIVEYNWGDRKKEQEFIEWYKRSYIEHYDLVNDVEVSVWVRKVCKLGSNIGSRVYYTLKENKILEDLKKLDFFGWLCGNDHAKNKTKQVFSITLNLILNKIAFERFEKLREGRKEHLKDLTIEEETFKLFKYMKSLEWIEKEVLESG